MNAHPTPGREKGHRGERHGTGGSSGTAHCVLAVRLPGWRPGGLSSCNPPARPRRTTPPAPEKTGVDFWHAVEFSRNGHFHRAAHTAAPGVSLLFPSLAGPPGVPAAHRSGLPAFPAAFRRFPTISDRSDRPPAPPARRKPSSRTPRPIPTSETLATFLRSGLIAPALVRPAVRTLADTIPNGNSPTFPFRTQANGPRRRPTHKTEKDSRTRQIAHETEVRNGRPGTVRARSVSGAHRQAARRT